MAGVHLLDRTGVSYDRTGRTADRFLAVGSDLNGCDSIGGRFLLQRLGDGRLRSRGGSAALHRNPRQRRDGLMEIGRVLAKSDEALMANLGIGFSSALEGQRAPAASNGGGGVGSTR